MVLTIDLPANLHKKIQQEKNKTGLSKGYIVRQIILAHYAKAPHFVRQTTHKESI